MAAISYKHSLKGKFTQHDAKLQILFEQVLQCRKKPTANYKELQLVVYQKWICTHVNMCTCTHIHM